MINKKLLICLFVCSIATFLIGCSLVTTNKNAKNLQGNIVIWSSPQKEDLLLYEKNKFIEKNKKVIINVESIDDDKIYDKLSEYLASGAKLPSIVDINDNYISGIANKYSDRFIDINNAIPFQKNDYSPSKQNKVIINGKALAMPWDTYPIAVFYRKDVFMNSGIDVNTIKTYTQFIVAGKEILDLTSGKSKIMAINSKGDNFLFNIFLSQLRESYFDKDGKCIVASDKAIRALKMMKTIYDSGITYSYSDETSLQKGIDDGSVVAIPYDNLLTERLIKDSSVLKDKWGVFNLPAFEAGGNRNAQIDGSSLMIPKNSNSKVTDIALGFAKYITTDTGALNYETSSYGIIPSYIPAYTSKVFTQPQNFFNGDNIYDTFINVSENSDVTISAPNYKEVDEKVIKACNDVIFKDADAKLVLTEIQNESNK